MSLRELETLNAFDALIDEGASLAGVVLQELDLTDRSAALHSRSVAGAVFLGCDLTPADARYVVDAGAAVFPHFPDLPYRPYRAHLYTPEELMGHYRPGDHSSLARTVDDRIYRHFEATGGGRPTSILEDLARRLHDHAITDALDEHLAGSSVVAIMGGHSLSRAEPAYRDVAGMARSLREKGFTLVSGGGPGAMEATHLGASFAGHGDRELDAAIGVLKPAPSYEETAAWLDTAFEVWRSLPADDPGDGGDGAATHVGIPTWLYGHEPPTVFAPRIAKYFRNSLREEGLVTLARGGIIFAPGSAGTVQEIFQDATQNHYVTEGIASPMVFLGRAHWTDTLPVIPLLTALAGERPYADLVTVTDDPAEAVAAIERFRPHLE